MVIEVGKRDKQYVLDVVNVILCDLKLEEDPWFKIRNERLRWILYFVFTAVMFIVALLLTIKYRNTVLGICTAVFALCAFHACGYVYSSGKVMKALAEKDRVTYVFNREGVKCDYHNEQIITFQWEYFRYIKRYGTGLFFIPKKKAAAILAIPIVSESEIRNYLKENGINLEFYD